ncbi:MAG: glycoside hydrolase family 2 TIM barrel-domain containing protein [Gemmatimonadales bacterium]
MLLAVVGMLAPAVADAQRQRYLLDPGWRFAPGDHAGASSADYNDRAWRRLDLPHDWSIEGTAARDAPGGGQFAFLPGGVAWYRKTFRLPAGARGRSVLLEFDGVYMHGEVWLNGERIGGRPFGYLGFALDVSDRVRSGDNVVAVRVDNSAQPNSRWYSGSGIYRHVWLTVTDRLRFAHWTTTVTTPRAEPVGGRVAVRTVLENTHRAVRSGVVRWTVTAPDGQDVAAGEVPFSVAPGASATVESALDVAAPRLWSVATPELYALRSEILVAGRAVDRETTTFGFRTIEYHADRGFLLNGGPVKMKGVNLHFDAGGLGVAVPERVWESRLATLRAMGVNAIRTSHHPPAPEFLDLTDRMGFLVMDEAFDEWTFGKVPHGYHTLFADWGERDAADFVRRDRNHPSVALWSAGNEVGEQASPDGATVLRRLQDVFHREDPTRPVTTGNDKIVAEDGAATEAFLNAVDIVGYNYVDRWGGRRETFAEADRLRHPEWKLLGTESGWIFESFDDRPTLGTDPDRVRANYPAALIQAERIWKWVATRDYFAGNYIWTGIDYLGEATWPFKGFASGALDLTGFPKDPFYLYRSVWTAEPSLKIVPHWTWPGREGQPVPVLVYTNCTAVELFLDGRSLGEKRLEFPAQGVSGGWNTYAEPRAEPTTGDLHLAWDVPYRPGVLRAVGRRRDGSEACHDEVRSAGVPVAVRLAPERDTITTGFGDVAMVRIEIVDAAGVVVPAADEYVTVSVTGGTLLSLDSGNLRDLEPYGASRRRTYQGRALAVIRPDGPGRVVVSVTADRRLAGSATIPVTAAPAPPALPASR